MYNLRTDEEDAGGIKNPQKKNNKCCQGAVYCSEFCYGTHIPCEYMLGDFKKGCCEECTGKGV